MPPRGTDPPGLSRYTAILLAAALHAIVVALLLVAPAREPRTVERERVIAVTLVPMVPMSTHDAAAPTPDDTVPAQRSVPEVTASLTMPRFGIAALAPLGCPIDAREQAGARRRDCDARSAAHPERMRIIVALGSLGAVTHDAAAGAIRRAGERDGAVPRTADEMSTPMWLLTRERGPLDFDFIPKTRPDGVQRVMNSASTFWR